MPQYAKTRKGAPEGFEYITVKPVKIGEAEVSVGLGKSGAFKIASPQIDGATVTGKGKTFDDAINDLIRAMSPVVPAGVLAEEFPDTEETAPVKSKPVKAKTVPADKMADGLLSGLTPDADTDMEPEPEPEDDAKGSGVRESGMAGPELSALVMSAYRRSAEAITAMNQGGTPSADARRISKAAADEITALCAEGREAGVDGDKVERLRHYGTRLVGHHYRLAGGSDGERLTPKQAARARQKFGSVAKSLAA